MKSTASTDTPELLITGPATGPRLVLGHGAGAPMDSDWMNAVAEGLAARGVRVVRFEFPYMAARRQGRRRPPDREPKLLDTWRQVVAEVGAPETLCIGGKSMGGRMASMVADELGVAGLVCLGYPFHPPGKPESTRTAHLASLATRTLIVQGTRDTFGTRADVAGYSLSRAIALRWLDDGDHSFVPRKSSGRTEKQALDEAVQAVAAFVEERAG